jgi:hypothetical protein
MKLMERTNSASPNIGDLPTTKIPQTATTQAQTPIITRSAKDKTRLTNHL